MINFSKAIYERFTNSLSYPLFEIEAPQETPLPYVVYSVISDVNTPTFTENYESIRLQFSVYSESGTVEVLTMMKAIQGVFDELTCPVSTTGNIVSTERVSAFWDTVLTDSGEKEYQGVIDYAILYHIY